MTFMIGIPKEFDTKCCQPFCKNHADLYRWPDFETEDPTPVLFLCDEHAKEFGYCWGCGHFFGGVESFEFGLRSRAGLCSECYGELSADACGYDEDDYEDEF